MITNDKKNLVAAVLENKEVAAWYASEFDVKSPDDVTENQLADMIIADAVAAE